HFKVTVQGVAREADFAPSGRPWLYSLLLDGRSYTISSEGSSEGSGAGQDLTVNGETHAVEVARDLGFGGRRGAGTGAAGPAKLKAPIPGLVVRVDVNAGDDVEEGQTLAVVEAMKMQMELKSPRAGRVVEVSVQSGQEVNQGQVLVVVGDPAEP
ncbi:MAG: acyl-CoA carboxylase biotin carboxyl carrier protein subunit, partial [Chloroflexota bacterium]